MVFWPGTPVDTVGLSWEETNETTYVSSASGDPVARRRGSFPRDRLCFTLQEM